MRPLILASLCAVCACDAPKTPSACRPRPVSPGLGVAHVAGGYSVKHGDESFLRAGANRTLELGARSLKLFLTPRFREQYPQPWPDHVDSLEALVRTPQLTEVFDLPFDTFVLTTVSFSMGVDDPWRDADVPLRVLGEAAELEGMLRFLGARYAGTGKTFIIQNWEGDWALAGGFDAKVQVTAERAARMQTFLNARHEVIARVRGETPAGVTFASAVEANLVLDDHTLRVATAVLPEVCTDMVSYSAWEATDVGALPAEQQRAELDARLSKALDRLSAAAPGAGLYLGEFGLPENEVRDVGPLVAQALSTAAAHGATGAVYWQVFDNECNTSGACRGLWLVRPNGTQGLAAAALAGGGLRR